ncbi:hypothetical protein DL96DRAFT_699856 [Flagelloscypha sp. PMI_526]|nr:hypothetical protein DL96DRAFT_699856 [Flagelloscypha sp. PMI_526]
MKSRSGRLNVAEIAQARAHNQSSKICQLPTEILAEIFHVHREKILSDVVYEDDFVRTASTLEIGTNSSILWLQPSHVCSIWRDTALAYPPLWNVIHLNNVEATKVLLRRSAQSPLHISRRLSRRQLKPREIGILVKCLKLVIHQSHRIESLDLSALALSNVKSLKTLKDAFASVDLKALKQLKAPFEAPQAHLDGLARSLSQFLGPIVQGLISSPSSVLTELSLLELPDGWDSIEVASLRSLEVDGLSEHQLPLFEAGLRRLQHLETLSIYAEISAAAAADNDSGDKIVLSQLRKLKLRGQPRIDLRFLSRLSCQPSELVIGISQPEEQVDADGQVITVLEALQPWLKPLPLVCAVILHLSPYHLQIQFANVSIVRIDKPVFPQNIHFDLCAMLDDERHLDFSDPGGVTAQLGPHLLSTENFVFHFEQLGHFNLSLARSWLNFAGTLSKLTTLEVIIYGRFLVQDLIFDALNVRSSAHGIIPFPALQTLILRMAQFEASARKKATGSRSDILQGLDAIWEDEDTSMPLSTLTSFLKDRVKVKKPIQRLVLDDCGGISVNFIDTKIRPLVGEVVLENEPLMTE